MRWAEWFAMEAARLAGHQGPLPPELRQMLARCLPTQTSAAVDALTRRGVEIGASILAGVLADATVRNAIRNLVANGLAQLDEPRDGHLKVLVVGIGDKTALSLRRQFDRTLTLWHWNRGHGVSYLAHAGEGAGLVIAYRKPGNDARALLDRMGHRHVHHVDRIAHLRSTLLALASMPPGASDTGADTQPARH
jgi:hypothetical protein